MSQQDVENKDTGTTQVNILQGAADLPSNFYHHQLPNGLTIIGQYMSGVRSISFGFQLDAGARDEKDAQIGLSHLLEYMMFEGTEHRSVRELTEEFESIGARKGSEAATEWVRYSAQITASKLDKAFDLFADILRYPTFPANEFSQMRNVVLQEIRRKEDEPMRRIFDLVRKNFFTGSTLGRPLLGTKETVNALTPEDLRAFWNKKYQPEHTVLSIAGNFNWDQVIELTSNLFGDWSGAGEISALQIPQPSNKVIVEFQEGNQEHLGLVFKSPKYGDPDYYAALLLSEIFGGSMTSRLFVEVREKRGLVYSVSSIFAPTSVLGAMYIYAGTTPEKANQTLQVILNEIQKLISDEITEDELRRAKVQLKSELIMRAESSSSRMAANARTWWYEKKLVPIQDVKNAIDSVTREQIKAMLTKFDPRKPLIVGAIGPLSQENLLANTGLS